MKLVKNNGQYKLTLPIDLVRDKGWAPGTEFRFVEDTEGKVYLKVIEPQPKEPQHKARGGERNA